MQIYHKDPAMQDCENSSGKVFSVMCCNDRDFYWAKLSKAIWGLHIFSSGLCYNVVGGLLQRLSARIHNNGDGWVFTKLRTYNTNGYGHTKDSSMYFFIKKHSSIFPKRSLASFVRPRLRRKKYIKQIFAKISKLYKKLYERNFIISA